MTRAFFVFLYISGLLLTGCSSSNPPPPRYPNLKGEYLYRHQDEYLFQPVPPQLVVREAYPWEESTSSHYPKITKEFFRCKGSLLNPVRIVQKEKEQIRYYDCGGPQRHSLPLRDGKEFIYPILVDLLNYVQNKTNKRVVITCGHCCPDHNLYLDSSASNQVSKHLL